MSVDNPPAGEADTGGQDKILAALAALGQATAQQIAAHTGLGYSTVTARLRKLVEAGSVDKQQPGAGPTSWRPAGGTPHPHQRRDPREPQPAGAEPDTPGVAGAETAGSAGSTAGTGPDTTIPPPTTAGGEDTAGGTATGATTPVVNTTGTTTATRRPPGQLRQQVLGVLQDAPEQTFTPHQISKLLDGASSGAIVLACRKLVSDGNVIQVADKPATFQAV